MNAPARRLQWLVWGALALTVLAIVAGYLRQRRSGADRPALPILFAVAPFTLTNQAGQSLASTSLLGQVWVADIIFTRCAGPCARMTRRLAELQAALPAAQPVRFVSLTTDPDHDTPAVLDQYARRFNADPARWQFLTGTKAQIGQAAMRSLKLTAEPKKPGEMDNPNDLFIHSTILVVVDKQGRARAVVETEPGDGPDGAGAADAAAMVRTNALPIVEQLLQETP
jgi:cytochrome oxidase Cu insertion factor (SCO1/SenC/PrrC family)